MLSSLLSSILFHPPEYTCEQDLPNRREWRGNISKKTPRIVVSLADNPVGSCVYLHGNSESVNDAVARLDQLTSLDELDVVAYEFPGFCSSDGTDIPTTQSEVTLDLQKHLQAYRRLRGGSKLPLLVWGRSLGGAYAAQVTSRLSVSGVILESTFGRLAMMAPVVERFAATQKLTNWLLRAIDMDLDSIDAMSGFTGPVLIMHSPDDTLIPFSHAEEMRIAVENGWMLCLDGDHNDDQTELINQSGVFSDFLSLATSC